MTKRCVVLGNTASKESGRISWTFYVRGATEYVREVVVKLHPTLKEPRRVLRGPVFEVSEKGRDSFDLQVEVRWLDGASQLLTWKLQLNKADLSTEVPVPVEILTAAPVDAKVAPEASKKSAKPKSQAAGSAASGSKAAGSAASGSKAGASPGPPPPELPVLSQADMEAARAPVCARLQKLQFMDIDHDLFMHGRAYDGPVQAPRCTWKCEKPPRDDHRTATWLTASEFQDQPQVVAAKCKQLAQLIRMSRKTVAYTGAGISAAVVGQAARSGQITQGFKPEPKKAKPTFTHHALGLLGQRGLIHSWVQQNHDGLPQKAGFPQECINEIHGSWYDPGNPVVKYSGSLHSRAFPWMEDDARTADLVLVLGTSLSGLNADQVATDAAERAERGMSLGTVCINLQQTKEDGTMSLRLFGKSDDILRGLLQELGFGRISFRDPVWSQERRVLVPYDADGERLPPGSKEKKMWLDLSDRAKVKITAGHNIQGAKQPQFMHIGKGGKEGLGCVIKREDDKAAYVLQIEGATMHLGVWWLEAAARGGPEALPVVNVDPKFQ